MKPYELINEKATYTVEQMLWFYEAGFKIAGQSQVPENPLELKLQQLWKKYDDGTEVQMLLVYNPKIKLYQTIRLDKWRD
jgi:hypothetical protein